MAVLASLDAPGGAVGDTFADKKITHVIASGKYVWIPTDEQTVFPGDNGAIVVGKKNFYYSDEAVPTATAVVGNQGQEFTIARASYPSGSDAATQEAGTVSETHYTRDADSWVATLGATDPGVALTAAETVLIDQDGINNTFYAFSTGDTWAQIKAKFEKIRFDVMTSDAGTTLVVPHTKMLFPDQIDQWAAHSGRLLVNASGVNVGIVTPTDTDTGFTYQQASGDAPGIGRMRFVVTGIPKGMLFNNAESSGPGTYQVRKNADGTFDLV